MGFWDSLFGEKMEIKLPDGSIRRVTRKRFDEWVREGKARPVSTQEVIREVTSAADVQASVLLKSPSEHAEGLGVQVLFVSSNQIAPLMEVGNRRLPDESQVYLFAEYTAFLIAYVDRLALKKFGEPKRSEFMNAVVDQIKRSFMNHHCLGQSTLERDEFLEQLIAQRLQDYSSTLDMASHIFAGAKFLVESFCDHIPESE